MPAKVRLMSLDLLRGATIAAMVLVNNAGDESSSYWPLQHARWNGWTPTDLIFPFFLFMVGVSMAFSFRSRLERGDSRWELTKHVLWRGLIIFAIGLFLNGFPNSLSFDVAGVWSTAAHRHLLRRLRLVGAVDEQADANCVDRRLPRRLLDHHALRAGTGLWDSHA